MILGFPPNVPSEYQESVQTIAEAWRLKNQQNADANGITLDKTESTNNSNGMSCKTLGKGDQGETKYCGILAHGHVWPGGNYGCEENTNQDNCEIYKSVMGPLRTDINGNEIIWDFFKRFKK